MQKRSLPANGSTTITMPEALNRAWLEVHRKEIVPSAPECILDFGITVRIDTAGLAYIRMLHTLSAKKGRKVVVKNLRPELQKVLHSLPEFSEIKKTSERQSPFVHLGDSMLKTFSEVAYALSVLAEMLYWGTIGLFKKHDIKRGALGEQMYQLGFRAVFIVALLSFLIGMVLSLQSAIQLRTYGAGIFLAPLIGITMVREMGPLLTAIILAGRTGSATTAEIATMGVNEEIDALKTMGINPIQFVVVPKFWAISITMPLLSIIATTAGIVGGYVIAMVYLDLSSALFFGELSKYLKFGDIWAGFVKSVVFSWLIIWVGSFYGLRVHGGVEAVGKETTSSVVTGIFIIIITDALFSFLL